MTMLGAESFNGPLNQADLNAMGYWAGSYATTGAGVSYGNPLQYRSIMRPAQSAVSGAFPFSSATANEGYPGLINLGMAKDLYDKGGFWVGITANFLATGPTAVVSNGTKIVGVGTNLLNGYTTSDFVDWAPVTNTSSGVVGSTVKTPLSYSGGSYYIGGQASDSSFFWGVSTDVPGNFVLTQMQASSNTFMNSLLEFMRGTIGGVAYYGGGYISSPSVMSRIVRSSTGATNSWSAVYTGTGVGQIYKLYEFGSAMYAAEYSTIGGNARGQVLRSTDGTTWTAVHTAVSVNSAGTCRRMAWDGVQALVVVGAGGYIASSTDNGITWAQRTSGTTDTLVDVVWTGSEFSVVTHLGNTLTSPDGLAWTFKGVALFRGLSIASDALTCVKVGSELLGYANDGSVALRWLPASKEWSVIRYTNSTYNNNAASTVPTGVFFGVPQGGVNSIISAGMSMFGFSMLTDGLWTVGANGAFNWGSKQYQFNTTPAANTSSPKRLELDYIAVPGQSVPTFDVYAYVDGVRSPTPFRLAGAAVSRVFFNLGGSGHNQWYAFAYGDKAGTRNINPPGNLRILQKRNTVDTQAQWDKVPTSAVTNAEAAQGNGSWTQSLSSVQSSVVGQVDQYSGGMPTVPAGYRIAGLQLGAAAQRVGLTMPTVEIGLIDNGAALPTAAAVLSNTTKIMPLRLLYETDNAGQGWSTASASNALVSVENKAFDPNEDPYWAAVVLLAKFNGAAGSTTLVDSSNKTRMTPLNNVLQSAGQAKYYPTSLDLTNPLTGVQLQLNSNWLWGSDDYTIETWMYPTSSAAASIVFFPSETSSGNYFYLTRMTDNTMRMLAYRNSSLTTLGTTTNTMANGAWSHFAVSRQSGVVRIFINGVLGATINDAFTYTNPVTTGYIGVQNTSGGSPFVGYMSEFRVTMGVARYTANFTPPTAALPDH